MTALRLVAEDGRKIGVLTRGDIIEALREYGERYGTDFPQSAFAPSQAKRNGRPDLVEIYYKGRADGRRWPSLNAVKSKFDGSWNDARAAAGYGPNSTGPAAGRRPPGQAEPILTIRERLVYVPSEKTKQLQDRVERLQERLRAQQARAERAEQRAAELRARGPVIRERTVREAPVVKTKTTTKTIKVRDERGLERLRSKLADEQAARRATEDQLKKAGKDRDAASRAADLRARELAVALADAKSATEEAKRMADRLAAAEARIERLSDGLEHARSLTADAAERATASQLVREAEQRMEQAELRAARAERVAAEHAQAATGQQRILTKSELDALRAKGPAGPAVLAQALKRLARARASNDGDLDAALMAVARAAMTWRDRLG